MNKSSITIIDDNNLRGIVAPASVVSKEMLEDFVDMIELSTPESLTEYAELVKKADRDNSWIPFEEVERRAKEAE